MRVVDCPLCGGDMSGPDAAPITDHNGLTVGVGQFSACRNCGYEAAEPDEGWQPVEVLRALWRRRIRALREMTR